MTAPNVFRFPSFDKYYVVEVRGKDFRHFSPAFPFYQGAIAYRNESLQTVTANATIRVIPLIDTEQD